MDAIVPTTHEACRYQCEKNQIPFMGDLVKPLHWVIDLDPDVKNVLMKISIKKVLCKHLLANHINHLFSLV